MKGYALGQISIADDPHVSISAAVRARVGPQLKAIPGTLERLLKSKRVDVATIPRKGNASAPSEDELTMAGDGSGTEGALEHIQTAYPDAKEPVMVMAVAERGPNAIVAAYAVTNKADGTGEITQIFRGVVKATELSEDVIKRWMEGSPEIVAGKLGLAGMAALLEREGIEGVKKALKDEEAQVAAKESKVAAPNAKAASKELPPAAERKSGEPYVPYAPKDWQSDGGPKGTGMLDDIDTKQGIMTMTTAPTGRQDGKVTPGAAAATPGSGMLDGIDDAGGVMQRVGTDWTKPAEPGAKPKGATPAP